MLRTTAILALVCLATSAAAGGGPFGIDHRIGYDDSGIWKRRNQLLLQDATAVVVAGAALWEGDDTRFGHTSWQAFDSLALGSVATAGLKLAFSRARPSQTDDPNQWFRGHGHNSFPSGEVMEVAASVMPYMLEYGPEQPAVYALELLPLYDAVARVKVRAHWQSDVLASLAIGAGIGAYAHARPSSLSVELLPRGVTISWRTRF